MNESDRDILGRVVRLAWIAWARTRPDPEPSRLVPYEGLDEPDREADRQIGEALIRAACDNPEIGEILGRQEKVGRSKIGSVWVDTASLLIGDPCCVIPEPGEKPHIDYGRYIGLWDEQGTKGTDPSLAQLEAIADREGIDIPPGLRGLERITWPGHVTIENRNGVPGALVIRSESDGWYRVYLERDGGKRPKRIVIDLTAWVEP